MSWTIIFSNVLCKYESMDIGDAAEEKKSKYMGALIFFLLNFYILECVLFDYLNIVGLQVHE